MNLRDGGGVLNVGGRLVKWTTDRKIAEAYWQELLAEARAIKKRAAKNYSAKKSAAKKPAVRKPSAKKPAVRATRRTT